MPEFLVGEIRLEGRQAVATLQNLERLQARTMAAIHSNTRRADRGYADLSRTLTYVAHNTGRLNQAYDRQTAAIQRHSQMVRQNTIQLRDNAAMQIKNRIDRDRARQANESLTRSLGKLVVAYHAVRQAMNAMRGFWNASVVESVRLQEATQRLNVVLGEEAAGIERVAVNSARLFGQTKASLIETAGEVGHFFRNFGFGQKETAEYSMTLVELARDFASFNNLAGGAEQALNAMRSALIGLPRPARQLGVFVSELRVKNKALELGMKRVNGEFSDADKFLARYHIILEDSKLASGDFARTQHMLANSSRILKAQIGDLAREVGDALNPMLTDAVNSVIELFTTDQQAALFDYGARVSEVALRLKGMGGEAAGTKGRVAAMFDALRLSGGKSIHVMDTLVAQLDEMGVGFDDLNVRQRKALLDGLVPSLVQVADRIHDLETRSFGEKILGGLVDTLKFVAGPIGMITGEIIGHFADLEEPTENWRETLKGVDEMVEGFPEGVAKWLRALDKVGAYLPHLNGLLRRHGREEIDLAKLRREMAKVNRETYADYANFRNLKEMEIRRELMATGRFTREEAERTAHIVVEFAIEQNQAYHEFIEGAKEAGQSVADFAHEQGLLNDVMSAGVPVFGLAGSEISRYADEVGWLHDDAEDAYEELSALDRFLVNQVTYGNPYKLTADGLKEIVSAGPKAAAEIIAMGAAIQIAKLVAGDDPLAAAEQAAAIRAQAVSEITSLRLASLAAQGYHGATVASIVADAGFGDGTEYTSSGTGVFGHTTAPQTDPQPGGGGGGGGDADFKEFFNLVPTAIVSAGGKRATLDDRLQIAGSAQSLWNSRRRVDKGASKQTAVNDAVRGWKQSDAGRERQKTPAELAQEAQFTSVRGWVDRGFADYPSVGAVARYGVARQILGEVDAWEEATGRAATESFIGGKTAAAVQRFLGPTKLDAGVDTSQDLIDPGAPGTVESLLREDSYFKGIGETLTALHEGGQVRRGECGLAGDAVGAGEC